MQRTEKSGNAAKWNGRRHLPSPRPTRCSTFALASMCTSPMNPAQCACVGVRARVFSRLTHATHVHCVSCDHETDPRPLHGDGVPGVWRLVRDRCAMALVHSRVRRVVYAAANPGSGALGSHLSLHTMPKLNHHFRVRRLFTVPCLQRAAFRQCSAAHILRTGTITSSIVSPRCFKGCERLSVTRICDERDCAWATFHLQQDANATPRTQQTTPIIHKPPRCGNPCTWH